MWFLAVVLYRKSGPTFVEGSIVAGHSGIAQVVLPLATPQLVIFTFQDTAFVSKTRDVGPRVSAIESPKCSLRKVSSILESHFPADDHCLLVCETFPTQYRPVLVHDLHHAVRVISP